eukprot:359821-Chlamydomonas_euryale.AAC.5
MHSDDLTRFASTDPARNISVSDVVGLFSSDQCGRPPNWLVAMVHSWHGMRPTGMRARVTLPLRGKEGRAMPSQVEIPPPEHLQSSQATIP